MHSAKRTLSGWGNYPKQTAYTYRPEELRDLQTILDEGEQSSYIAYGLGRSYGDTPLNQDGGIIQFERLDRYVSFDKESGIVTCEAGVSLYDMIETFAPKGFFLPVTPGTTFVTVGGAIANDIHGKNHHVDGCFSEFVLSFDLYTASGETVTCSRDENAELFWATIGGIGLTGLIVRATIQLLPIETSYINVNYEKAHNLDEAFDKFVEGDHLYQYSVAWIDCLASGDSLGRSVLMRGNHASVEDLPADKARDPLQVKQNQKLMIPVDFPAFALNQWSIAAFNEVYYRWFSNEAKLVDMTSFFHPLDSIKDWNKMYGKNGFVQYQAVFPKDNQPKEGLRELIKRLSNAKLSSFLAVLKSSGPANEGMLSFPMEGYTLALDIPIKDESLFDFLAELDELVLSYGGRVYLAKDSTLRPEAFREMYPRYEEFMKVKNEVDPEGVFSSSMARRLELMEVPES